MFASTAAGATQVTLNAARQLSETDNQIEIPFWVIIVVVILIITLLLCGCTCFVVRCFAPEVTQGPAWEINSYGTQWVRWTSPGDDKPNQGGVVHSLSDRSYPGAIPVYDPKHNAYDRNNPEQYMRPKNFDDKNNPEFRNERREVLDRVNGLYVGKGGDRLGKKNQVPRQTAAP